MAMNNLMIDPVTGQPLQKMQPQLDPMTGMPVQPVAEQIPMPNQAVYGKQRPMQIAENVFGTSQMRQNSVMMTQAQENYFGPEGTNPNPEIYNAIKDKEQ